MKFFRRFRRSRKTTYTPHRPYLLPDPAVTIPLEVAGQFIATWDDSMLASSIGERLTCTEVDALAELFTQLGRPQAARVWIECHAEGDDPEDDHFGQAEPPFDLPYAA